MTKDRFEVASKAVAIIGGLTSAIILIVTLNAGTTQREIELRWNQAKLAMELLDGMVSDPQAFNALRLIDWDPYVHEIKGEKATISSQQVQEALNVENNENLSRNGVFIRESFDRLFYHMGKVERSLKSDLIRFEDVRSPMDYYVPFLRCKYGTVLMPYMEQLHQADALTFMERFDQSELSCASSDNTRGS